MTLIIVTILIGSPRSWDGDTAQTQVQIMTDRFIRGLTSGVISPLRL